MITSAIKLKVDEQIFEKGKNGVESIQINTDKETVEIKFEKNFEWNYKIIFLQNVKSIDFTIEKLNINPNIRASA